MGTGRNEVIIAVEGLEQSWSRAAGERKRVAETERAASAGRGYRGEARVHWCAPCVQWTVMQVQTWTSGLRLKPKAAVQYASRAL